MMNWHHPTLILRTNPLRPWFILFNLILVAIVGVISSVGTMLADSTIRGYLIIDQTKADWLSTAYMQMLAAAVPLSLVLATVFGVKRIFCIGLSIFILGSLGAAVAETYLFTIIFRVVSGAGAGILFPLSIKMIGDLFPKEKSVVPLALYVAMGFGMGLILGIYLGGYFSQIAYWQGIYYFTVISGCFSLLVSILLQHETETKSIKKFDWEGYLFFTLFVSSMLVMLANAKAPWNTEGWTSTFILSCIGIGIVSLVTFILVEKPDSYPIVNLAIFKIRPFVLGSMSIFLVGGCLFGTISTFSNYLEVNLQYEHIKIAYLLMPFGIVFGLVGAISAFLTRYVDVFIIVLVGMSIAAISCFMNHFLTIQSDQAQILSVLLVRALGLGFSMGPLTSMSLRKVNEDLIGYAAAMNTVSRQLGAAFGGSIIGVIRTMREVFHELRFGEAVDIFHPSYQIVFQQLKTRCMFQLGMSETLAEEQAHFYIGQNLKSQAAIVAIDDAFFVFGIGFIAVICLLITSYAYSKYKLSRRKKLIKL